jgi:Domain of unknown function (DUF5666)
MLKKVYLPVILALVIALSFSSVAYAASLPAGRTRLVGTVLNVISFEKTLQIETTAGVRLIIRVDDTTQFKGLAGSLADLRPAMYVKIVAVPHLNGMYHALSIDVLKQTFKGTVEGTVTSVSKPYFTIQGTDGKTYDFRVVPKTAFRGSGVTSLKELSAGMAVTVKYTDLKTGLLRAVDVVVH